MIPRTGPWVGRGLLSPPCGPRLGQSLSGGGVYVTSPTTSPQQRGEGNEATKGDPSPTGDPASAHAWRAPRSCRVARARR